MKEKVYLLRSPASIAKKNAYAECARNAGFSSVDFSSSLYLYSDREKDILSGKTIDEYRRVFYILEPVERKEKGESEQKHFKIPDTYVMRFSFAF